MKRQTMYCLLTLAGLLLSPLVYSSPDARRDRTASGQSQTAKPEATPQPPPSSGGLTKVGPGTLALNYVVRRDDGETKVEVLVESGAIKKVTATDADGTRTLKPVKPGGKLAQSCDALGQTEKSLTLDDGQVVKVGICKARLMGLLLPAVQKIREAAARTKSGSSNNRISGGASCTKEKPCCFEDEKLGMNVCSHL